jgi:phage terminase large subunit
MVRELFGVTPDAWQDEVLSDFPTHPRQAMRACKGPGKTAVLSWLSWGFLLTRPHPKVAATSISGDNLRDNLWAEMAYWRQRSTLLQEMFEWRSERITCKAFPETWWMSARTWRQSADKKQQANTLAGLHAPYVMVVLDESGGIPDAVGATADAIFSGTKEAHVVQAGNPTHLEGPLYRAATADADLWKNYSITGDPDDPKRSPRVSIEWARSQIRTYGADNPWVLVNVFGRFPPSSFNALLGPDDVDAAMARHYPAHVYSPAAKVLGVDVARFGSDPSIIFPRQGVVAFPPLELRNVNSLVGAGAVARKWAEWKADACFVDNTGGWGAGWIDQLQALGREPIAVPYAGKPNDPRFLNKRAEIIWDCAQAIKDGLALPNITQLKREATALTYTFHGDKIQIIEKEQVRALIGTSTDYFDALAQTYAQPVQAAWSVERQRMELGAADMLRAVTERDDEDRYSR